MFGLVSSLAAASQTVIVSGDGISRQAAIEDALDKASQEYCGVAVLSDKKVRDFKSEHRLSVYSSCRVTKAVVLDESVNQDVHLVSMKLSIERSNQSKRIFNQSDIHYQFDKDDLQSTVKSYSNEKNRGDKYLSQVMSDFSHHAFELVSYDKPYITEGNNRQLFVIVPYTVIWNKQFVDVMESTIKQFSFTKKWYSQEILPGDEITFRYKNKDVQYNITDSNRFKIIMSQMLAAQEPYIRIKIYISTSDLIHSSCTAFKDGNQSTNYMYNIWQGNSKNVIFFQPNNFITNSIALPIDSKTTIDNIELELVPYKDCKN